MKDYAFLQRRIRASSIRMRTSDELAASIRRRAIATVDPRQSAKLHRLADEAGQICIVGPSRKLT